MVLGLLLGVLGLDRQQCRRPPACSARSGPPAAPRRGSPPAATGCAPAGCRCRRAAAPSGSRSRPGPRRPRGPCRHRRAGRRWSTPCSTAWRACPVPGSSRRGLDPQRLRPAGRAAALGDLRADRLQVVELGGVDDDRRLLRRLGGSRARRPRAGSGRGAGGAARSGAGAPPASAPRGAPRPGDQQRQQEDEHDRADGDPAGIVSEHDADVTRREVTAPGRPPDGRIARTSAGFRAARPRRERHHGRMTRRRGRPTGQQPRPAAIAPDTKDWTWVLQRPCPDCGFDAEDYPGARCPRSCTPRTSAGPTCSPARASRTGPRRACGRRWSTSATSATSAS